MDFQLHLLKAERNKKFLFEFLLNAIEVCPDWASVLAFYSALHFMEAFLKKTHNLDFEHHEERHKFLSRVMPEIFDAYYRLYDLGFTSRYKSIKDGPTRAETESAIEYELAEVEEYVKSRI
jgi:hypothetical protein